MCYPVGEVYALPREKKIVSRFPKGRRELRPPVPLERAQAKRAHLKDKVALLRI